VLPLEQGSPDLVAASRSTRAAGARTVAIVKATSLPVADEAEFVVPIEAGQEHYVAATKTVVGSKAASAGLVAELAEDRALRSALDSLPERCTASEIGDDPPIGLSAAKLQHGPRCHRAHQFS
jgi:fructoselysine-6-P-deglycase FrlB-like protein